MGPRDRGPDSLAAYVDAPEILTAPEAAALLRVDEDQLLAAAARHELPGRAIAGEWRFSRAALLSWLGRDHDHNAAPPPLERLGQHRSDTVHETGLEYMPGDPVRVRVVRREHRIDVTDDGTAIEKAGQPSGWRRAAHRVAEELVVNVSAHGVISLPVVRAGPAEERIVRRIAEASLALYQDLLELEG
jgi:Helix-turn-helix domain